MPPAAAIFSTNGSGFFAWQIWLSVVSAYQARRRRVTTTRIATTVAGEQQQPAQCIDHARLVADAALVVDGASHLCRPMSSSVRVASVDAACSRAAVLPAFSAVTSTGTPPSVMTSILLAVLDAACAAPPPPLLRLGHRACPRGPGAGRLRTQSC